MTSNTAKGGSSVIAAIVATSLAASLTMPSSFAFADASRYEDNQVESIGSSVAAVIDKEVAEGVNALKTQLDEAWRAVNFAEVALNDVAPAYDEVKAIYDKAVAGAAGAAAVSRRKVRDDRSYYRS